MNCDDTGAGEQAVNAPRCPMIRTSTEGGQKVCDELASIPYKGGGEEYPLVCFRCAQEMADDDDLIDDAGRTALKGQRFTRFHDDPKCDPYWIRVEDESNDYPLSGLITIAEEDTSSRASTAVPTNVRGAIDLSDVEALFVYEALGAILRKRGKLHG